MKAWLVERLAELSVIVVSVAAGVALVAWWANQSAAAIKQAVKVLEL